ncbi:hypothetical protein KKF04_02505 [Patescibacteria group bacterium]|nr:hypothetical protein [Patescibacteria group bacterium]MBU1934904.1 hypothetical protein [Patescibacteria group bacterium]
MSKLDYPDRIFSLSDCHGGQPVWDPLNSPDVAARLAETIRSDLPGIQHFDTHGVPERYHDHIVREAVRLHRENPESNTTGLFINSAPRTEANQNGEPFYRAEFDENIRITATPLSALSAVRSSVKKLLVLPNEDNELYNGKKEQHRSSYTPKLLAENHGLNLEEVDPSSIPELPGGCTLAYIDRFGNLVLFEDGLQESQKIRKTIAENLRANVKFKIGDTICDLKIGESLSTTQPGSLVIYGNDGNIEILGKWDKNWSPQQRLQNSAYAQFEKPEIGTECSIEGEPTRVLSLANIEKMDLAFLSRVWG